MLLISSNISNVSIIFSADDASSHAFLFAINAESFWKFTKWSCTRFLFIIEYARFGLTFATFMSFLNAIALQIIQVHSSWPCLTFSSKITKSFILSTTYFAWFTTTLKPAIFIIIAFWLLRPHQTFAIAITCSGLSPPWNFTWHSAFLPFAFILHTKWFFATHIFTNRRFWVLWAATVGSSFYAIHAKSIITNSIDCSIIIAIPRRLTSWWIFIITSTVTTAYTSATGILPASHVTPNFSKYASISFPAYMITITWLATWRLLFCNNSFFSGT